MLCVIHNKAKFNHPLMSVINKIQIHLVPINIPLLAIRKRGVQKITLKYFCRNKVHSNNQKAILRYISGCNKPSIILTYVDKNH